MFSKLFLLLAVFQLTVAYDYDAENEPKVISISVDGTGEITVSGNATSVIYVAADGTRTKNSKHIEERKIRNHILWRMSLASQGLRSINTKVNPESENIQYFPMLQTIRDNMILMLIYEINKLEIFCNEDKFLQVPLALASFLNELEQFSNITLIFRKFKPLDENQTVEEVMKDLIDYYRTVIRTNISSIDDNRLKMRLDSWHNVPIEEIADHKIIALKLAACWSKEANKQTLYFQIPLRDNGGFIETCLDSFSAKMMLGYHNNSRLGYQAIRIPYENSGFSMAAILPNEDKSFMEIFQNFTSQDYLELLEGITSGEKKYIHYSIPKIDIAMVVMNETGTWINSNEFSSCNSSQHDEYGCKPWKESEGFLKPIPFFVGKPFSIIIFHERTRFVLWQAWIRNPNSKFYHPYKFSTHKNGTRGKIIDDRFII